MSTAKNLLNSKRLKDLRTWWVSVVRDSRFEEIKLLTRSEYLDTQPSTDNLSGAMRYETIMESLPFSEDSGEDVLSQVNPGLNHDLDIKHEPDKKKK